MIEAPANVNPERVREIADWLSAYPCGPVVPASDRGFWQARLQEKEWSSLVPEARSLLRKPVPPLPDDVYLDFSRTGNRVRCQKVLNQRDSRLEILVLAECLEDKGHFIPALCETIEALCAEKTWVLPAHDRDLRCFNGKAMDMDLRATLVGWDLATARYLLGEKLPAETRARLRSELDRRILKPFREIVEGRAKGAYWLKATHNWNAVCLAGVAGTALAVVEDPRERAWFVAAAEHYIQYFLSGFTPDGYCSEGMGYWNYGYGRFLMLTELLRQSTDGRIDLLQDPAAGPAGLYAIRAEIIQGVYPSIADCSPNARPTAIYVKYLADRFNLDRLERKSESYTARSRSIGPSLVFAGIKEPLPQIAPPALAKPEQHRTWFQAGGVLVCRPGPGNPPFAAVLKAGHNAEHHNHNDLGSFSVLSGKSVLVCDPGAEVYTARTFSSKRYDSKLLNSYGHSVPVLDGKLQSPGVNARAKVLKTEFTDSSDLLVLDLTSGYAVPDLSRFEREFTYRRGLKPGLTVTDKVLFKSPGSFETALITWGKWTESSPGIIRIEDQGEALEVRIDTGHRSFAIASELLEEDVGGGRQPTRIGIRLEAPVQEATVILTISPAK